MKTPFDNLSEGHFEPSSLRPGVSGESRNAPYGPKAVDECGIDSVHTEYNAQADNEMVHGFKVGMTDGPSQAGMGDSSLKPGVNHL